MERQYTNAPPVPWPRRVADLTASNHPDDPLYGVPDGYLDQEDLDYYSDLFAKTKGYCRR